MSPKINEISSPYRLLAILFCNPCAHERIRLPTEREGVASFLLDAFVRLRVFVERFLVGLSLDVAMR